MRGSFRKVYVLGSGFSKSLCPSLPTLKDLDGRLFRPLGSGLGQLEEYCKEFASLCNRQPEYLKVEDVATAILGVQVFPGEEDRLRHETLRFQLLRFIQRSMRQHHPLADDSARILGKFLSACVHDSEDDGDRSLVISFNYDTLLENQLRSSPPSGGCRVDYGINLVPADAQSEIRQPSPQRLSLLKLHGSLNWYRLKGAALQSDLRSASLVEEGDASAALYQSDNPIFIPMAHAKDTYLRGSLFSMLWAKADYYLGLAEEIHYIGYGFPRTDINNLAFLLRHRTRTRSVVVFENESDPELDRLRRLLGTDRVINQDARLWLDRHFSTAPAAQ